MRLYIGKNHRGKTTRPVQSIFRLIGSDEDALTYSLGFLLAQDYEFCKKLIKLLGIAPRRLRLSPNYAVLLQEVTDRKYGRRDIVIEDGGTRIVLEAKIGDAVPSAEQLLKYATEKKLWHQYGVRGVAALTQIKLEAMQCKRVQPQLTEIGIQFSNIQWHEVLDLAIQHRPYVEADELRYFFDEFITFAREDYEMGYYDAEILIQDVDHINAPIFKEGWVYVTDPRRDKKSPLYFAPYFTEKVFQNKVGESGLYMISRVIHTEIAILADKIKAIDGHENVIPHGLSDDHRNCWRHGLMKLWELRGCEDWTKSEARFFYLNKPITFAKKPLKKKAMSWNNQTAKGRTLRFDELLSLVPTPD